MALVLCAPAKLTLSLRITGVRSDGMHTIDAEMVTLSLADDLSIEPAGTGSVRIEGPAAGAMAGIAGPDDLVRRAMVLAGRNPDVDLYKRIPAGAGLGGGSSDAAALLRWAGFRDVEAAARLGADVAFCLVGGRARVRGIGEFVEPAPFAPEIYTLFTPPLHCSTPVVYRTWDDLGGPVDDASGNDLAPAALAAYPELAVWRDAMAQRTGMQPRLAGSGSTWFVEGAHPGPGHVVVTTTPAP